MPSDDVVASRAIRVPRVVVAAGYEAAAAGVLDPAHYAFISGGSERDITLQANRDAFDAVRLVPRVLRSPGALDTRCRWASESWPHPIMLAPLAHQAMLHPRAERETARGAQAADACLVVSMRSSCSIEQIAAQAGPKRWFQLCWQQDRPRTLALVQRARAAGYRGIMLTLDATIQRPSERALRAGFDPRDLGLSANDAWPGAADGPTYWSAAELAATSPGREDLRWLVARTDMPIVAKGVLHPEDARLMRELGMAGIAVSNHGGRSLDGAISSLRALPSIRAAVGRDFPVLLDSGVRSGSDVFKALAIGADAVMIGRLQAYALAVAGALGVGHVIRLLCEELQVCMALTGCSSLDEVRRSRVEHPFAKALG